MTEKDAPQNMKEMSLLGRLQQDVDMIIAWKTNADMFTIETFIFSFLFISFFSVYLKNEKLLLVVLMLSQAFTSLSFFRSMRVSSRNKSN